MAVSPTTNSPNAIAAIGAVGYPTPSAPATTANAPAAPVAQPAPVAPPPIVAAPAKPTAPGAVVTAAPAVADVNAKMGVVNQLAASQTSTPPPMATLVNTATGDRKAVPVGSQQAQALFGQGYTLENKAPAANAGTPPAAGTNAGQAAANQPTGLTPLPTAPTAPDQQEAGKAAADEFTQNNADITAKADQAFNDYQTQVNQMRNGTFPLTPDQQAMIDNISSQYQSLIADQKIANQNYQGAVKLAGIRAGRNMYAPEIELGNVNAAISKGTRDIADLNTKMSSAIATARIAYQESNFKLLDATYDKIRQHMEDQRKVVADTYTAAKDALASAQDKFKNDMATANFNLEVAKETNKPILEADAKMKDFMYSEMQKYPDAGITSADTVATATEKIKNSESYKAAKAQEAANLEATKANTAQSYAAADASRAAAAKSRKESAGGGTDNNPVVKANVHTIKGQQFINLADFPDMAGKKEAQAYGAANGIPVLNPSEGEKMVSISNAYDNAEKMSASMQGLLATKKGENITKGIGNYLADKMGDEKIRSFNAWRTTVINNVQALAGGQGSGLRINQAEIDTALKNDLPNIEGAGADTLASAQAKLNRLTEQMDTWRNTLINKSGTSGAAPSGGTTELTGPDGNRYAVPNDQVDQFIKDGGHR